MVFSVCFHKSVFLSHRRDEAPAPGISLFENLTVIVAF